jgi:hypothetical protein
MMKVAPHLTRRSGGSHPGARPPAADEAEEREGEAPRARPAAAGPWNADRGQLGFGGPWAAIDARFLMHSLPLLASLHPATEPTAGYTRNELADVTGNRATDGLRIGSAAPLGVRQMDQL